MKSSRLKTFNHKKQQFENISIQTADFHCTLSDQ